MTETPERRPEPKRGREDDLRWVGTEIDRRIREEDPDRREALEPLDNFPAEPGWFARSGPARRPRGPDGGSPALAAVIHGSCNGWPEKPTALEAEAAIKARRRNDDADDIAWTVVTESSTTLIIEAEAEGAYSLQDLAWWIRELRIPAHGRIRWLNAAAEAWSAARTDRPGEAGP